MVRFQCEFHLFPTSSTGRSDFDRIFPLHNSADLASLPHDTRLRRVVVDYLQTGGDLRSGPVVGERPGQGKSGLPVVNRHNIASIQLLCCWKSRGIGSKS